MENYSVKKINRILIFVLFPNNALLYGEKRVNQRIWMIDLMTLVSVNRSMHVGGVKINNPTRSIYYPNRLNNNQS